ncbi:MAG: hypothetical protein MZW92_06545 [Comamonadaceae bacterium]|nr:hypothetical protein [Comamonadaceae bacterium]
MAKLIICGADVRVRRHPAPRRDGMPGLQALQGGHRLPGRTGQRRPRVGSAAHPEPHGRLAQPAPRDPRGHGHP